MKNKFSNILGEKRQKISDVHEGTGISRVILTNLYYEKDINIQVKTLIKICDFLNVSLEELIQYEPDEGEE